MKTAQLKFNSLKDFGKAINGQDNKPEKWAEFLQKKGHTPQTFSYLPEHLKTALKFSFAKKY